MSIRFCSQGCRFGRFARADRVVSLALGLFAFALCRLDRRFRDLFCCRFISERSLGLSECPVGISLRRARQKILPLGDLFRNFPVGLLAPETPTASRDAIE